MTGRKNKAVAVRVFGVFGIDVHLLEIEIGINFSGRKRTTGVSGFSGMGRHQDVLSDLICHFFQFLNVHKRILSDSGSFSVSVPAAVRNCRRIAFQTTMVIVGNYLRAIPGSEAGRQTHWSGTVWCNQFQGNTPSCAFCVQVKNWCSGRRHHLER